MTATADVLSDVLRAVRLTGAVYFDFEMSAPWVAEAPPSAEIAAQVLPGAQRVIEYHLVARGHCWGGLIGSEPVLLREGDLLGFPQGDRHVLSSAPGMRNAPNYRMYERSTAPLPYFHEFGGGGSERTRIICSFLGCDERPYNPLLTSLPPVLHLPAAAAPSRVGWMATLMATAASESRETRPGSENVLERFAELLFVESIRHYMESAPAIATGWLAGLRDELVGRSLAALHVDPGSEWTVDRLARQVGVSRSILAERFTAMVGQPPMLYLALWRMQLAARLIADGSAVGAAGRAVGYDSEASFSRAFKKLVGRSPAHWRRGTKAEAPAPGA